MVILKFGLSHALFADRPKNVACLPPVCLSILLGLCFHLAGHQDFLFLLTEQSLFLLKNLLPFDVADFFVP